jgi:tetratricopeptide (TPR) repeat protein
MLSECFDPYLPEHLRIALAVRRSINLRAMGGHTKSDLVLNVFSQGAAICGQDIRLHCAHGRLLLSKAENAIQRDEFDEAESYLTRWEVKNVPPSELELQVVRLKNTAIGRVLRYLGKFEDSCHYLKECLNTIPGKESRYHVMHHLADIYCELQCPQEAERLVKQEVDRFRSQSKERTKPFRRLLLPLAEAYILQEAYGVATTVLLELTDIYRGISKPDVSDQLGHVRSVMGLARVHWHTGQYNEARGALADSLALIEEYETFVKKGFYAGVAHLFLSIVDTKLQNEQEAQASLSLAHECLQAQFARLFMPGIGTYVLSYLWKRVRLYGLQDLS